MYLAELGFQFIKVIVCFVGTRSLMADFLLGPAMLARLYSVAVSTNRADIAVDAVRSFYELIESLPGYQNYQKVFESWLLNLYTVLPAALADHVLRFWSVESKYDFFPTVVVTLALFECLEPSMCICQPRP